MPTKIAEPGVNSCRSFDYDPCAPMLTTEITVSGRVV